MNDLRHEERAVVRIGESRRWDGTTNIPDWPCAYCGLSWDTEGGLRSHFVDEHPGVVVGETFPWGHEAKQNRHPAPVGRESGRTGAERLSSVTGAVIALSVAVVCLAVVIACLLWVLAV